MNNLIINEQNIQSKIFSVRDKQVMIDRDLAELYGVETKVFNQASPWRYSSAREYDGVCGLLEIERAF